MEDLRFPKNKLNKCHSKNARCFCQKMSRNSQIAIEGLRRLYGEKLASDFPNVHAGRLTETTRPRTNKSLKILQKSSVRTVRLRCRIPTPTSCPWRQRRRITKAKTYLCTHYADSEHLRCLYVFPKDLRPAGFGGIQKISQSERLQPAVTARTSAQHVALTGRRPQAVDKIRSDERREADPREPGRNRGN